MWQSKRKPSIFLSLRWVVLKSGTKTLSNNFLDQISMLYPIKLEIKRLMKTKHEFVENWLLNVNERK